jgi:hypothetical protein
MGEDQYMNITVEQELKFPDTTFLSSVLSPEQVAEDNKLMHSSLTPSRSMRLATKMQYLASLLHSVSTHFKLHNIVASALSHAGRDQAPVTL